MASTSPEPSMSTTYTPSTGYSSLYPPTISTPGSSPSPLSQELELPATLTPPAQPTPPSQPTPTQHPQSYAPTVDYTSFPPFYTLQPNLTTRTRQLDLWSQHITNYARTNQVFKISLSSPPPALFSNPTISRSLPPASIRAVLEHMAQPTNGSVVEFLPPESKGGKSDIAYVWWRSASSWADEMYTWVEETGQKGAVLTLWEPREGDAARGKDWIQMDEGMFRKVLAVLVKKGRAQIFAGVGGVEGGEGVKFF